MTNKGTILIDVQENMSSVSLIEGGLLNEFYVEFNHNYSLTGNIYKGRVVNVLPGLETAFVDIGLNKNAFLFIGETHDKEKSHKINEGDFVMVQVTKEETKDKGAMVTTNISIPGRLLLYLPQIDFAGVSGRITDAETRHRLLKVIEKIKKPNDGFVARTLCMEESVSEIEKEAKVLRELSKVVTEKYLESGIGLIHSEDNLLLRCVRDILSKNIEKIYCNDKKTTNELKEKCKIHHPSFHNLIEYHNDKIDILDEFGVIKQLDKLLEKTVTLGCGGTLNIDKTTALTAIDVNTHKFVGGVDHEQTIYETNMQAAKEIARQLRLRNTGGLVVVDFIDMYSEEQLDDVLNLLRSEVAQDRVKTRVMGSIGFGLVALTRKKMGNELRKYLLDDCDECGGRIHSKNYMMRKMKAGLKRLFSEGDHTQAFIALCPYFSKQISAFNEFISDCKQIWPDKDISFVSSPTAKTGEFYVSGR
ncbi:MAG: Rne/Rng family ribonuclease [Firmicutes bacterium]|nr:Rne/Rng family ribonuclease [Bacillota bacterium]MCL2255881.1 Rne/Rng family ribonuclease [Bacillota bacterium]